VSQRLARDAVRERNISHRPHRYQRYTNLDQNDWIKTPRTAGRSSGPAPKWPRNWLLTCRNYGKCQRYGYQWKGPEERRSGCMERAGVSFIVPTGGPSRKKSTAQPAAQRHGGALAAD